MGPALATRLIRNPPIWNNHTTKTHLVFRAGSYCSVEKITRKLFDRKTGQGVAESAGLTAFLEGFSMARNY